MNTEFGSKRKHKASSKGFTLVEVLITVAITAIIMGVIGTLFFSGASTYSTGSRKAFVQNDTRLGMELIQNEIRYARKLNLLENGFDPETAGEGNDLSYISFQETEKDAGKIVIFKDNGDDFHKVVLPGQYSKDSFFGIADNDTENGKILLELHLSGLYNGSESVLTTSINLLNMSSSGTGINQDDAVLPEQSLTIEYLK
ncbi:PilW family protein [Proteiniclasticum sp. C24MP]|uniref:PilW family protein n=1 Tax=Proteiniclasticum sp. C24MP TaxID=3374101 RepID=UPI003754FFC3